MRREAWSGLGSANAAAVLEPLSHGGWGVRQAQEAGGLPCLQPSAEIGWVPSKSSLGLDETHPQNHGDTRDRMRCPRPSVACVSRPQEQQLGARWPSQGQPPK